MFNILQSSSDLFILTLLFFTAFLVLRFLLRNKVFICLYHTLLFCGLFLFAWAGGSVQNDGYYELRELEKKHKAQLAERKSYDPKLMHEIAELRKYLIRNDATVDKIESVFIAWLLAFFVEISMLLAMIVNAVGNAIRGSPNRKGT